MENNFIQFINSQFFKTLMSLIFFIVSSTWYLSTMKSEIMNSFVNLEHKIEIQNINMENRLRNLEDTQERNFKYITENYLKKSDFYNQKVK